MTASGEYKATNGRRKIIRDQISGFTKRLEAIKNQPEPAKISRKAKMKIKPSLIAIYASVFVLVVVIIFSGYHQPINSTVTANVADTNNKIATINTSVDNVVATNIAAIVAQNASLPVASNIINLAISTQTQFQFDQANSLVSSKPQIIGSGVANRAIINYTAKAGDTIDSIAANFKISKDTIKWANNLVYDSVSVGKVLRILPVDGVAYVVKASDTIDSIAKKYSVDKTRLVVFNDLDVSGLTVGNEIILPGSNLPADQRPGYVAPVVYYAGLGAGFGGSTWNIGYGTPGYAGNTYAYGNCTRYAYDRRVELGRRVSANWGNASSWAWLAAADGLSVDSKPSVGAVIQNGGGLGHVGIVEEIKSNGDITVSEMNAYVSGGGWNVVSGRNILAGNVSLYLYIH